MIHFVDEDESQLSPILLELALRGHETHHISNADDALDAVAEVTAVDFLCIDVMLAARTEESRSAFKRDETDDYKTTGLRLVELILERRRDFPKGHIILMSQAASASMRKTIETFCKRTAVPFVPKSKFDDPMAFGDEIERIMKGQ